MTLNPINKGSEIIFIIQTTNQLDPDPFKLLIKKNKRKPKQNDFINLLDFSKLNSLEIGGV